MSRGHDRERAVRDWFIQRDWLAFRAPASLGVADVIALRDGCRPRLVEVKSTTSPYAHFGPADRADLLAAAKLAGAVPLLAWWPSRGKLRFIHADEWPATRLGEERAA